MTKNILMKINCCEKCGSKDYKIFIDYSVIIDIQTNKRLKFLQCEKCGNYILFDLITYKFYKDKYFKYSNIKIFCNFSGNSTVKCSECKYFYGLLKPELYFIDDKNESKMFESKIICKNVYKLNPLKNE